MREHMRCLKKVLLVNFTRYCSLFNLMKILYNLNRLFEINKIKIGPFNHPNEKIFMDWKYANDFPPKTSV